MSNTWGTPRTARHQRVQAHGETLRTRWELLVLVWAFRGSIWHKSPSSLFPGWQSVAVKGPRIYSFPYRDKEVLLNRLKGDPLCIGAPLFHAAEHLTAAGQDLSRSPSMNTAEVDSLGNIRNIRGWHWPFVHNTLHCANLNFCFAPVFVISRLQTIPMWTSFCLIVYRKHIGALQCELKTWGVFHSFIRKL